MGSTVFPQALYMVPRNPTQCPPRKPGFYAFASHRPSSFNSVRLSASRTSTSAFGLCFDPFVTKVALRSLIVRAESNSEGEPGIAENIEEKEIVDPEASEPESESEVKSEVETEAKPPRKPRIRLGEIMGILNKRAIKASEKERPVPDLRTGDIVQIKLEVPENRRRLSIYKGIVISKQNAGIHTTIRIRRIIAGIGVEIVFPVYSPNIKEIKVVSHRKVRRARLYYLRDKLPRLSTFK